MGYLTCRRSFLWKATQDISAATTLISGHPWPEPRKMIHEHFQKVRPQITAVTEVVHTPTPAVHDSYPGKSVRFKPHNARQEITRLFEENQPRPNANRWRLSGKAKSLTFGAQTGRGSDAGCVINRTLEPRCAKFIQLMHQMAQSIVGPVFPYLDFRSSS